MSNCLLHISDSHSIILMGLSPKPAPLPVLPPFRSGHSASQEPRRCSRHTGNAVPSTINSTSLILCPFLPISTITELDQNPFVSLPPHCDSLPVPCWGTYFTSKLQPAGSFLKASVTMSPPSPLKYRQSLTSITQSARPARSGLLSPPALPYPTPPSFLGLSPPPISIFNLLGSPPPSQGFICVVSCPECSFHSCFRPWLNYHFLRY